MDIQEAGWLVWFLEAKAAMQYDSNSPESYQTIKLRMRMGYSRSVPNFSNTSVTSPRSQSTGRARHRSNVQSTSWKFTVYSVLCTGTLCYNSVLCALTSYVVLCPWSLIWEHDVYFHFCLPSPIPVKSIMYGVLC